MVPAGSDYQTLEDLVAYAKANPGAVSIGTMSVGTDEHMALLQLEQAAGIDLTAVPFGSANEAKTALLGGHITAIGLNVGKYATADKDAMRTLAQFADQRSVLAPDLPTASDQGYDVIMSSERGLAAHRDVPQEIRDRLAVAVDAALASVVVCPWAQQGFWVSHWRGKQTYAIKAVDDVSLDLWRGENLGIVAENGSGKTTLGRMLLRIIEPSGGSILWQGDGSAQEVTTMGREALAHNRTAMRLVFQDPFASLNPRMTVRQVIADPLIVAGGLKSAALDDRVGELLETVGLERTAMERYPHAFSDGQRQRIGIVRALALNPRVIIADEAISALDVSIRAQVPDLLFDPPKPLDPSFVFIARDISVVRYFCDRVAVMHRGCIVESGSAEDICTPPADP